MSKKYKNLYSLILSLPILFTANYSVAESIDDESSSTNVEEVNVKKTLTGDWFGIRKSLQDSGITIKASLTSFYQGISNKPDDKKYNYEFGSKLSSMFIFNGEKLDLWKGFFMVARTDYNMGHNVNSQGGILLPVNSALGYPGIEGSDRFDYSLYAIQFLSPETKIIAGKLNMFDMTNFSNYKGGSGKKGFQNVAFVSAPNGITTPEVIGAFLVNDTSTLSYTLAVYGANNIINKNFAFREAFKDGTSFYASTDYKVNLFDLPGKQGVSIVYSNKDVYDLQELESSVASNEFVLQGNRYSYSYYFEQALLSFDKEHKKYFGVFGQFTKSDGKGTPIDWSMIIGFAGNSFIPNRNNDKLGIAYSRYSLIKELTGLPYPVTQGHLRDEITVEAYYDFVINPWLSIGADVQKIKAGGNKNDDTVLGMRIGINL